MKEQPILIAVDDWRTFRIDEQGGQVRLQVQVSGDGGSVLRIEPDVVHAIIEALEGLECMQGQSQSSLDCVPDTAMTYRNWCYWVEEFSDGYQPVVFNDDTESTPFCLSPSPSHQAALKSAIAWIDRQYVSDDNPASNASHALFEKVKQRLWDEEKR